MNPPPPVTVLMPAYNAGTYIGKAIDSVLSQDFPYFELLIINDGSTDNTTDVIAGYNDPRIRLVNKENEGIIATLNKGLQLAKGTYIARFDADDICYPHRLGVQYRFMEQNSDYVLAGSAADYIDKDGNFLFEWQPPAYDSTTLIHSLQTQSSFDHPTVIYRKDTALKLGGYPKGAIHFEDHIFWTLFAREGKIMNTPERLIQKRFNPGSVTIDEKWRGPVFKKIKYQSIANGFVSEEDHQRLLKTLKGQDHNQYKEAAYYSMIGKKYLWNQYKPALARKNFRLAIKNMPFKVEPYILSLLSFLPQDIIKRLYQSIKEREK